MARLPEFSPRLDDRLTAEFLAHSLTLLPFSLRQDAAMLDASALRLVRPEPPRDPDLPLLPPKVYPRPDMALVEAVARSLIPPAAVDGFAGRKAELDQAVLALLADRSVVITGESGTGKTALLRQLAHDTRIRTHFKRVWWLDDLQQAGITLGLALNAPSVLRAEPADQPRLIREFLADTRTLLLIDNVDDVDWALGCTPTIAIAAREASSPATTVIGLGGLPADAGIDLLRRLSDKPEAVVQPLAALVGYLPGAIRLVAALMVEDGVEPQTITDFLNSVPDNRLAALYTSSYEALPEAYQGLCRALAASPHDWIATEAVLASFIKPLVGHRALTFIERRGFIERRADAVRALGPWVNTVPPAEAGFLALPRPAAQFDPTSGTSSAAIEQGRIHHQQGVMLIDEGRDAEAETALNQALELRQAHDTDYAVAETLVALARLSYLQGDDTAAIRKLEAAAERLHDLRDDESLEVIRIALSRVYRRAGRLDAALSVLGDDSSPDDLTAVYRARGEWDEAIAVYARWLDQKPSWARLGIAETHILAGRYADALAAIADSNLFEAHWLRAMIYHMQGNVEKALSIYTRIRPDIPSALRAAFARTYARALAASDEVHDAALLVGAEGVWYEAKMPRPVFARQRMSQALFAHLSLMLGKTEQAETAARAALDLPGERPNPEAAAIANRVLGRITWGRGELDRAQAYFEAERDARGSMAYRDDHETGVTLHNLADVLRERGERDRAIANYRRALTHKDATYDRYSVLLTRLSLRQLLLESGRQPEGLEIGQETIDLMLRPPEADLQMIGYAMTTQAQAQFQYGRPGRGEQALNNWLARLAARIDEGVAHPYWGARLLASGLCLRAILSMPTDGLPVDDPVVLVDLAEQAVETAEANMPDTWIAWAARRDLGNIYLKLERWQDAYEVFDPLIAREPEIGEQAPFVSLAARLGSARAAAHLEQVEDAIRHYDAALPFEPVQQTRGLLVRETAEMYRNIGNDSRAAERYVKALELLQRDLSPSTYIDTIVALAYARLRLRRYNDAIDTFTEAIAIVEGLPKPDPALMGSVLFDMATAHVTLGQYRRAVDTYRRALTYQDASRSPERYVETLIALGRSLVAVESYQPAIETYHEALQFDSLTNDQRRELLTEQADVFKRLGLAQAAIDTYRSALGVNGGSSIELATIHRNLGALYTGLNVHDKARTHFQQSLSAVRDEQSGLTLQSLGEGYRAQGEWQKAVEAYLRAIDALDRKTHPVELASVHRAAGEIYLRLEQADDAVNHLEAALDIEKTQPQQDVGRIVSTLQSLGQAHERRGELELATRRHHEALVYQDVRYTPEGYIETLRTLGRLYAQMQRYNEAVKAYEEALATEQKQDDPAPDRIDDMTGALADVYRAQGRLEDAAFLYRKVTQEAQSAKAASVRQHATESLQTAEAEINRHLQTLQAAEQSWILLNRVAKPDLKGLAFVRAIQAQTSAALGRWEDSDKYLDQMLGLLRKRRSEVKLDDPRSIMRALAMLLQAQDYEEAQNVEAAANAYQHALSIAEHDAKSEIAFVWAIRQRAGKENRK
ncbi:MAG: tetratricopeptide repeat protein [Anaerolineae bacterium]|nr:tetratricopeptide repeat protein [Anaerolineae bacterium]